ncbi:MAG: DUF1559 domain-containing protein [Pirellulales bacterium]
MTRRRRAFSLVELLVVIAIIAALVSLLLPAVQSARAAARSTTCKNNIRQIGLAMVQYCDLHDGEFPTYAHNIKNASESWLWQLQPFLEEVDEIRICPEDPKGPARLETESTSYVINDYIAAKVKGGVRNMNKLKALSRTMTVFEGSDQRSTEFANEHVHASEWFSPLNQKMGTVEWQIQRDIQPDRHQGSAHYLYADAHVAVLPAADIYQWVRDGVDFARPQ